MGTRKKIKAKKYLELLQKTCSDNVILLCACVVAVVIFLLLQQVKASQYIIIAALIYIGIYFWRLVAFERFRNY